MTSLDGVPREKAARGDPPASDFGRDVRVISAWGRWGGGLSQRRMQSE